MLRPPLPPLHAFIDSGMPGRLIPFALQKSMLERALDLAFRQAFMRGDLEVLRRRWLRVRVTDAGFVWCVSLGRDGLVISRDHFEPDVEFAGRLVDFLLMATHRADPDMLFFQRRIKVNGDTDLGVACKNILDAVDESKLPRALNGLLHLATDMLEARPTSGHAAPGTTARNPRSHPHVASGRQDQ